MKATNHDLIQFTPLNLQFVALGWLAIPADRKVSHPQENGLHALH